jgi:hypothetical protein
VPTFKNKSEVNDLLVKSRHYEVLRPKIDWKLCYKTTWMNPLPDTEIVSLDYVSAMAPSAPFLLAVTAEP